MKKVLFVLVLMLSAGVIANAQFKFGIKAAMNVAGVNADGTDSKIGVSAGLLGQYKFSDRWALQVEGLYNMQGYNAFGESNTLSYVAVPVMVQFYIIEGLSIELGPQLGILVAAKAKDDDDGSKRDVKDHIETMEVSLATGVAYELSSVPVGFFARYTAGLTDINKTSGWATNLKNYGFQLGAFVKF